MLLLTISWTRNMLSHGLLDGFFCCKNLIFHVVHRKGADNPVADNLSRMENILDDPIPVNDNFPDEQLVAIKVKHSWKPLVCRLC